MENARMKTDEKLFSGFAPVSTREWEERILADLKGKEYDKALVWRTREGFAARPYYRAEDLAGMPHLSSLPGQYPFVRGNDHAASWLIRQDLPVTGLTETNRKALEILGKGIDSLGFVFDCSAGRTLSDLELLLKDISPVAAEINFVCSCRNCDVTKAFAAWIRSGRWDAGQITASVNNDPLTLLMLKGRYEEGSETEAFSRLQTLVEAGRELPGFAPSGSTASFSATAAPPSSRSWPFRWLWGRNTLPGLLIPGCRPTRWLPASSSTSASATIISWKSPGSVPAAFSGPALSALSVPERRRA